MELDEFSDLTHVGVKGFTNIISTKDASASRQVLLSDTDEVKLI